jgi:hypothetical protein
MAYFPRSFLKEDFKKKENNFQKSWSLSKQDRECPKLCNGVIKKHNYSFKKWHVLCNHKRLALLLLVVSVDRWSTTTQLIYAAST